MKKYILTAVLLVTLLNSNSFAQVGQWTWMKGDTSITPVAVYGIKGVPAAANTPPGMYEAVEWTDTSGNFWLFSGLGTSEQSDLWKFDPVAGEWTWVKGPGLGLQPGVYGTKGVPSPTNNPGARAWGSPTWVDANGDLWLFGGIGYDMLGGHVIFNDLWKYNISSNEWAWMAGGDTGVYNPVYGTQGVFNATNDPGNRAESDASWVDKNGNLWMFGGAIYKGHTGNWSIQGCASDLWEYDVTKNQWAWIKGPSTLNAAGVYGTRGVPNINNNPSGRDAYNKWVDSNGDFWLFGGTNINNGNKFNDLWKYNIASNTWTWMSGSNIPNDTSTAGAQQCTPSSTALPGARHESRSSFIDKCGNLWLMGGQDPSPGYDVLNDLWKYDPAKNQWTWVSGHIGTGTPAYNYGTQGVSAPSNLPPGRMGHPGWSDNGGNLWLWGGARSGFSHQNDLWKYVPDSSCTSCASVVPPIASFLTSDSSFCANNCTGFQNLSLNSTSWQWSFQGAAPSASTDKNPLNICYQTPGTFSVSLIAYNGSSSDTLIYNTYINVFPTPPTPTITQSHDTLFCSIDSTYKSYQWYDDTTIIAGATMAFTVFTHNGNYNIQVTNEYGCSIAVGINVVGIKEFSNNNFGFTISPNPVADELKISNIKYMIKEVNIYNVIGQKAAPLVDLQRKEADITIDVSRLAQGVYFIEVLTDNGKGIGKFVKE